MEILAFFNQKGGVAKTTTTLAVGGALRRKGKRVLFVDLDPQCSLSKIVQANITAEHTICEVMTGKLEAKHTIQDSSHGHIIAASRALTLAVARAEIVGQNRLREALEPLEGFYDYVLIDCPPSLGVLSLAALVAATGCIIPCQADILSLEALEEMEDTLELAKTELNKSLRILGVVITRFSGRTVVARTLADMIEEKAAEMGTRLFSTRIREGVAITEAQAIREDLFSHAPKSNAAADYSALVDEILEG